MSYMEVDDATGNSELLNGTCRKLPLWETCLANMRERGIGFGSVFETKWLEGQLSAASETLEFGASVSRINDELLDYGFYLSSRNQNGKRFVICDPEAAEAVADSRIRRSFKELSRGVRLFSGVLFNPNANLTETAKRRLSTKAERNAVRLLMLKRSHAVERVVNKHDPKILSL